MPDHIKSVELRLAYALKEIGPSIFCATFCESLAFFVGMLTDVPALWSFCLVAGIAVILDFLLQITLFIAALSLDGKRIQSERADILFCIKAKNVKQPRKEVIRSAFERYFVPFVFNKITEFLILGISVLLFVLGICACLKI